MNADKRVFISYATKYDQYTGIKNWDSLTLNQRKTIIRGEFFGDQFDYEEFIIATGLKKLQAQGLRSVFISTRMLCEEKGLIKEGDSDEEIGNAVIQLLAGTKLYQDILAVLGGGVSVYDGVELERLAQTGSKPSVLDRMLDMKPHDAHVFLLNHLDSSDVLVEKPKVNLNVENLSLGKNSSVIEKFRCVWDFFRCSEVRWIRAAISDFFSRNHLTEDALVRLCLKAGSNADKAKYSIRVDGLKPQQIALIIIGNVAFSELVSGTHHVYRGVLSQVGKEYMRIFRQAGVESVNLGFDTKENVERDIEELQDIINRIG